MAANQTKIYLNRVKPVTKSAVLYGLESAVTEARPPARAGGLLFCTKKNRSQWKPVGAQWPRSSAPFMGAKLNKK
jgi:hypothetical protein